LKTKPGIDAGYVSAAPHQPSGTGTAQNRNLALGASEHADRRDAAPNAAEIGMLARVYQCPSR
jgi:hypothetical protein